MHHYIVQFFLLLSVLFGMTPMARASSYVNEVSASGEVVYYHYDNIGSTIALTNGTGVIMERIEYEPYGTILYRERMAGFEGNLHDTPYLFAGFYGCQTDRNGLIYLRERYYNPLIKRFINADPAREGWNWYAYAGDNPLRFIDPSGFAPGSIGSDFTSFLSKAVEYIPLLGNLLQAERAFNTGNYTQAAIYTGLAVLDVAPPVKLTTTTAILAQYIYGERGRNDLIFRDVFSNGAATSQYVLSDAISTTTSISDTAGVISPFATYFIKWQ